MNDNLLTAQEVADLLKIKKNTVYEMIKRGDLPCIKIGKQLRIPSKEVEHLLNSTAASVPSPEVFGAAPRAVGTSSANSLILCGQDISLDLIANYFSANPKMPNILRSHAGSYNGLHLLYQGRAQIATTHLWDERTKSYNTPYIERLLPGLSAVAIRLFGRSMGFYVRKGNPKHITGWEDLRRRDLTIVNREKGSGTRVLLDEKLKALLIPRFSIAGYNDEHTSHLSVASAVSRGEGDIGLGIHPVVLQVPDLEFIPMQKEWIDMVFLQEQENEMAYRMIVDYVCSKAFLAEISRVGDYDFSQSGRIQKL